MSKVIRSLSILLAMVAMTTAGLSLRVLTTNQLFIENRSQISDNYIQFSSKVESKPVSLISSTGAATLILDVDDISGSFNVQVELPLETGSQKTVTLGTIDAAGQVYVYNLSDYTELDTPQDLIKVALDPSSGASATVFVKLIVQNSY